LRVAVKEVKTGKFAWKVTKGMTGGLDLQVSEINPDLCHLVKQIRSNPHAIGYLAAFLQCLDEVGVHDMLLDEKGD
jgi:hypothetical protein